MSMLHGAVRISKLDILIAKECSFERALRVVFDSLLDKYLRRLRNDKRCCPNIGMDKDGMALDTPLKIK